MIQYRMRKEWVFIGLALLALMLLFAAGQNASAQSNDWLAQYYDNPNLAGDNPRVARNEASINYRWGEGSPVSGIPDDNFSVRWTKAESFGGGPIRFTATMDDGMRVYLDGKVIIDSWYPSEEHTMTRDVNVTPGIHEIMVEYFEAGGLATAVFNYAPATGGSFYPNWKGEYFNNRSLSGAPVLVRDDRYLNQNWGTGSPAPGVVSADYWSARWTRTLNVPAGTYRIGVFSDDGARVYFNDQLVHDQWGGATGQTAYFNYSHAGGALPVRVEYYDDVRDASIYFSYDLVGPVGPVAPIAPIAPLPPTGPVAPVAPIAPIPSECPAPEALLAVVNTNYLNVRSGPGTQYEVLDVLEKCDQVFLTGVIDPTGVWVQLHNPVPTNKQQFWVNASYLEIAVPLSSFTVGG